MSLALAILVVVGFAATIALLGLPGRARESAARARRALAILRDPALDDDAKERRMREEAVGLFALAGVLVAGSGAAIGLPLLGVWTLDRAGVASLGGVLSVLGRLDFLAATTVAGVLVAALVRART